MQLEPYIFFHGTCEEALNFYAACLGGKVEGLNRFAGSPMEEHAGDGHPGTPPNGEDNMALSLAMDDVERARKIFHALAEGGTVTMEFSPAFWGGTFGSLTDRFGIQWMVSAGGPHA